MLLFIKVIISAFVILIITEIAKKNGTLAGIIAVLPINIILSLLWINFETKDIETINNFIHASFRGLLPLTLFLLAMYVCHRKNVSFEIGFILAFIILVISVFIQHKVIAQI